MWSAVHIDEYGVFFRTVKIVRQVGTGVQGRTVGTGDVAHFWLANVGAFKRVGRLGEGALLFSTSGHQHVFGRYVHAAVAVDKVMAALLYGRAVVAGCLG